jgi:hypothetical protein
MIGPICPNCATAPIIDGKAQDSGRVFIKSGASTIIPENTTQLIKKQTY